MNYTALWRRICILPALLLLGFPIHPQPSAGLSIRVTPGVGFAVGDPSVQGVMERSASLDLDYSVYQLPVLTISAGAFLSRAELQSSADNVVTKVDGHLGFSLSIYSMPRINLYMYGRAGLYTLITDDPDLAGLTAAGVSTGLRMYQPMPGMPAAQFLMDFGYTRNYEFRNYFYVLGGISLRVLKPRPIEMKEIEFRDLYPVLGPYYLSEPIGAMTLHNRDSIDVENISVTVYAEDIMDGPWLCFRLPVLAAGEERQLDLHALLSEESLQITTDKEIAVRVTVEYWRKDKEETGEYRGKLTVHSRNALTWVDDLQIASFVTSQDSEIFRLARNALALSMDSTVIGLDPTIQKLLAFHQLLADAGIRYLADPASPYSLRSEAEGEIDFVQFPVQTLINRAGDCDDLSVLYAALLEAAGTETAFITVPGHIFIAAALEEPPDALVSRQGVIEAEGRYWVPLETTALEGHFLTAWTTAMNEWTSAGDGARLFTLKQARKSYLTPDLEFPGYTAGIRDPVAYLNASVTERDRLGLRLVEPYAARLESRIMAGNASAMNSLGIMYARYGINDRARQLFLDAIDREDLPRAWENMGNLSYLEGDFRDALTFYRNAREKGEETPELLLQIARVQYELGEFDQARELFGIVSRTAPELIAGNAYLGWENSGSRAAGFRPDAFRWSE